MNLATEKLNLIQQILLLDEATFARLQRVVTTQVLTGKTLAATHSISGEELTAQFHLARQQAVSGETYSTAEVAAIMQQWLTK